MHITLIAALSKNGVIGVNNDLPWYIPEDLKRFKQLTLGKPIIMGRKTLESIGKPLKNRENIVVTRNRDYQFEGVHVLHSYKKALELAKSFEPDDIIIGGGAEIYRQSLEGATRMHLTYVDIELEGDTYFPKYDKDLWEETERSSHYSDKAGLHFDYVTLERTLTPLKDD